MTSSGLSRSQRRKIKKVARDWKKGKIGGPTQLHNRLQTELPELWLTRRKVVKAELDKAAASPSWKDRAKKVSKLLAWGLGVLVLLYVIGASVAVPLLLRDDLADAIGQWFATPTAAVVVAELPSPSPTQTIPLTTPTTPPPSPSDTPTPEPTSTPIAEPTLTHTPTPALIVSVKGDSQVKDEQLKLYSRSQGADWNPLPLVPQEESGTFAPSIRENQEPRQYKLEVRDLSGMYLKNITHTGGSWRNITNTVTGLITGTVSQDALEIATVSRIEVMLAAVPVISTKPVTGTYDTGNRRTAPYDEGSTLNLKGSVTNSVEVLGQWAEGNWRLSCCQEIANSDTNIGLPYKEYFWSGKGNFWVVDVLAEQEAQLPAIYLPSEVGDFLNSPYDWQTRVINGLAVLSNTEPVTLEWKIDNIQGWFQLQAWVPSGSQAATYQVFVLVDNIEVPLWPLAGIQEIAPVLDSELSGFQDIGTYHLHKERTVIVRLRPTEGGVKAAYIRVIKARTE
jgi:hypothetical protein